MSKSRFTKEQQPQIDRLVAYATLMGFTGDDLASIGTSIKRREKNVKIKANMSRIADFKCLPIGGDHPLEDYYDHRFKLKTVNGAYNIICGEYYGSFLIRSLKTKKEILSVCNIYKYDLPNVHASRQARYTLLLEIAAGNIKLDF